MSDIVFMRTWFKVDPEKFYNPLSSYQDTRLMKTTWELRKEREISAPINPDSEYKEIVRKKRVFNPLVIPKVFFLISLMFLYKLEARIQSTFCFKTKSTT